MIANLKKLYGGPPLMFGGGKSKFAKANKGRVSKKSAQSVDSSNMDASNNISS